MTTKTTTKITTADIDAGYDNVDYRGWGYLGEREQARYDDDVAESDIDWADDLAVTIANEIGMTPAEFFGWLNSRSGRHYADVTLHHGGAEPYDVECQVRGWGMVRPITD